MTDRFRLMAEELQRAREARQVVEPPSSRFETFNTADALAVARHHARAIGAVAGSKIGLTFEPVWGQVGAVEPFVAPMAANSVASTPWASLAPLTAPRLEVEIVALLSAPLQPGATLNEVRAAIGSVGLGFEMVDSHYPGWKATPPDLVADFGCHAGLCMGEQIEVDREALDLLDDLEVRLSRDDTESLVAHGRDVLGGPMHAVVAALRSTCAPSLSAGQLISTGSLTGRSHAVVAGQCWSAEVLSGPLLPPYRLELT